MTNFGGNVIVWAGIPKSGQAMRLSLRDFGSVCLNRGDDF
jgi:hypothetical protein